MYSSLFRVILNQIYLFGCAHNHRAHNTIVSICDINIQGKSHQFLNKGANSFQKKPFVGQSTFGMKPVQHFVRLNAYKICLLKAVKKVKNCPFSILIWSEFMEAIKMSECWEIYFSWPTGKAC